MTDDEKRGYAKGYKAGLLRRKKEQLDAQRMARQTAQRAALRDRAYIALLPVVFAPNFNWGTIDAAGKHTPYRKAKERIAFAWDQACAAADKVLL